MRYSCESSFRSGEERTPGIVSVLPAFKQLAPGLPTDAGKIFVMGCRLEHIRGQIRAGESVGPSLCRGVVFCQVCAIVSIEWIARGRMRSVGHLNHRLYPEVRDVWLHRAQFVGWQQL